METLPLELQQAVLERLDVRPRRPDLHLLDHLVASYVRTVPWESAFRIARRSGTADTSACPRWPRQFWLEHLEQGAGGTCFESNYAFYALLAVLGYRGYLTINDMGESVGCHTTIVLWLDEQKWLVDVGLPLFAPLPVDERLVTHRPTALMHYAVKPQGDRRFEIERHPHPNGNAFTLVDRPVDDAAYRRATTADYGPGGLFLDRVIVNKVIGDVVWRFNSAEQPYRLEAFQAGQRADYPLSGDIAKGVATHFELDEVTVRQAFAAVAGQNQ